MPSMNPPLRWADGHLDLAYLAVNGRDLTTSLPGDVDGCISLPALRHAGVDLVFATVFTELNYAGKPPADREPQMFERDDAEGAHQAGVAQIEIYEQLEAAGELTIVRAADDLVGDAPLPRIVILMEGADPIRTPTEAPWWFERGVRIVGLTWSMGSRYSGGNATGGGLTAQGCDLVAALDELKIIHDVSHLSEPAFFELLERSAGTVIASHSNARALSHTFGERNLSDAQIKALAERHGVIGLNLFTKFLAHGRRATVDDCVRHIEHITAVTGHRRGVALGTDMDGGFGASKLAKGVDHPSRFSALTDALRDHGWTDDERRGFARENWMNLLRAAL